MKSSVTSLRVCHTCACGCAYARGFAYACVIVRDAGSSSIVAGRVCRKFDATRVASRSVIQIDIVTGNARPHASDFLPEPLGSVGASPANGSRRQGTRPLATKP